MKDIDRREFVKRLSKTSAAVVAAGGISYALLDKAGPSRQAVDDLVSLGNFSVSPKPEKIISIVKAAQRKAAIEKAFDMMGGIEHFIKPGETVLIKPNVAFASAPMLGATSNPELVGEVVRLCYDRGRAKKVLVADNPINDPQSCFTLSGVAKAATDAGAKIVMPKDHYFKRTTLKGGKLIKNWPLFYQPFEKVDKLIGITPVKDHHRSGASMSMKNWYGLLGGRRNIFHQDINGIIAELAMMVSPTLVILDGFDVMKTNGPTGGSVSDLVQRNTIIVSTDQVAADSAGAGLLDMKVSELGYLGLAEKAGVGTTDHEKLKPMRAEI